MEIVRCSWNSNTIQEKWSKGANSENVPCQQQRCTHKRESVSKSCFLSKILFQPPSSDGKALLLNTKLLLTSCSFRRSPSSYTLYLPFYKGSGGVSIPVSWCVDTQEEGCPGKTQKDTPKSPWKTMQISQDNTRTVFLWRLTYLNFPSLPTHLTLSTLPTYLISSFLVPFFFFYPIFWFFSVTFSCLNPKYLHTLNVIITSFKWVKWHTSLIQLLLS